MTAIRYKILPNGAFVAGDTESGFTCYAYQSSQHADAARKSPAKVAEKMIRKELKSSRASMYAKDYDARNWQILNA
jgi:hypothetical protein